MNKCKTCGIEFSNKNGICPECGCYCKQIHFLTPFNTLVIGFIVLIYSLSCCFKDIYFENRIVDYIPVVIIASIIVCIYGGVSFFQNKNFKNFFGIGLAIIAIIISVIVRDFFGIIYVKKTIIIDDINIKYTFLCPSDMECSKLGYGVKFYPRDESLTSGKYRFSINSFSNVQYTNYHNEQLSKDKFKEVKKINDYFNIYYFDDNNYATLYDYNNEFLIQMYFKDDKYSEEIVNILSSLKIERG